LFVGQFAGPRAGVFQFGRAAVDLLLHQLQQLQFRDPPDRVGRGLLAVRVGGLRRLVVCGVRPVLLQCLLHVLQTHQGVLFGLLRDRSGVLTVQAAGRAVQLADRAAQGQGKGGRRRHFFGERGGFQLDRPLLASQGPHAGQLGSRPVALLPVMGIEFQRGVQGGLLAAGQTGDFLFQPLQLFVQ